MPKHSTETKVTVTEQFVVVAKDGYNISGYYSTLEQAEEYQKSWLQGHPSSEDGKHGWVHGRITTGGEVETLTDTYIVRQSKVILETLVPRSKRKWNPKKENGNGKKDRLRPTGKAHSKQAGRTGR